jgi:TatD DNase family protein
MPLELLLLETDAPWNSPEVFLEHKKVRNEPISIEIVARKIAEIKKISFEEVWKACGENAVKFFDLKL